jgi:polyisoprenoid-binding protein YceI
MAKKTWSVDPNHSEIQFKVKHLMITTVTGSFKSYQLTAETEENDFLSAQVHFSADIDSINTGVADRDAHLKSDDFFDGANHAQLTFESTKIEKESDEDYIVYGDLTIRGITKNIRLNAEFGGIVVDPYGQTKAGFTITGKVSRKEYGLKWNAITEAGGMVVSDEVKIACEVQLIEQK